MYDAASKQLDWQRTEQAMPGLASANPLHCTIHLSIAFCCISNQCTSQESNVLHHPACSPSLIEMPRAVNWKVRMRNSEKQL